MTTHPVELLSALLDGELGDADRRAVEAHVAACTSCARHLAELTAVDALAHGLPPAAAPEGYLDALPGRLRQRIRADRPFAARRPWILPLAAGLALAVLAPIVLNQQPSPHPRAPERPAVAMQAPQTPTPIPAIAAEPAKAASSVAAAAEGKLARTPNRAARPRQEAAAPQEARDTFAPPPPAAAAPVRAQAANAEPAPKRENDALGTAGRAEAVAEKTVDAPSSLKKAGPEEARRARDAWRRFVETHPEGPRADVARVRAIEAGVEAYRLGGEEADRVQALRDVDAYLARPDAAQAAHVQAIARPLRAAER